MNHRTSQFTGPGSTGIRAAELAGVPMCCRRRPGCRWSQGCDIRFSLLLIAALVVSFTVARAELPIDTPAPQSKNEWWSLRPPTRPSPPNLNPEQRRWTRTPIDSFVISKLAAAGLSPSPEADRRTLIRRLYFDLIGLPPSRADVQTFVDDPDPDAYEKLVDRLLASPRYGERWARHWLDLVHYGDTHGYDKDKPRPNAWPYRDYVIRSLNNDKPYARFVKEQIAGDILFPGDADAIVATGFIAAGPWDLIGHEELPENKMDGQIARHLDRDDMVATTMNTFVSLTVQCAQCHQHKFDPITQQDYYGLQAVFAALDRADRPYDDDPETGRQRQQLQIERNQLAAKLASLQSRVAELGGDELADLDRKIKVESDRAREKKLPESDTELEELKTARRNLVEALDDGKLHRELTQTDANLAEIKRALEKLPPPKVVYAGTVHFGNGNFRGTGPDGGKPREIRVLHRGDITAPAEVARPGSIAAIAHLTNHFALAADHAEGARRVALANWITDVNNPLTWRSIVNRVWLHHFDRGIVDSPNDFGRMGELPSHPELLDWLAVEFRDTGQSLKQLHRLLLNSATYRQSSRHDPRAAQIDSENKLLWRMNRRRLEAEAIRDAALAVSGRLDLAMCGPGFQDFVIEKPEHSPHYQYHLHDARDPRTHRRSIYRFIVRSQQQPFMTILDCADPSMQVAKRNQTLTPLQSLALLNNQFMLAMAESFAVRLEALSSDLSRQIELAYSIALARAPLPNEAERMMQYAREHGLANACRMILNLNEFIFVD